MALELDLAEILSRTQDASPAGTDLRSDPNPNNAYRKIRDLRNAARDRENRDDRGDPRRNDEPAAIDLWDQVWELGTAFLAETARDLEVAACLIEASIRLDGAAGFAQSLDLTTALIRDFWGNLYPAPDEDGIETTLRPIARLNGDPIYYPLQRIPITDPASSTPVVVWQVEQAQRVAKLQIEKPEEAEKLLARGALSQETLQQAVRESSNDFYESLTSDLKAATASLKTLEDTLESTVEDESALPNLSRFRDGLKEAASVLHGLVGSRLEAAAASSAAAGSAPQNRPAAGSGSGGGSQDRGLSVPGSISSRDDALAALERVAEWFQRNEPQSLIPAEVRKAIRRARMTPEELYKDLIEDDNVLRSLFRDVGIITRDQND
jgi:type VI secretion system protein ImpA